MLQCLLITVTPLILAEYWWEKNYTCTQWLCMDKILPGNLQLLVMLCFSRYFSTKLCEEWARSSRIAAGLQSHRSTTQCPYTTHHCGCSRKTLKMQIFSNEAQFLSQIHKWFSESMDISPSSPQEPFSCCPRLCQHWGWLQSCFLDWVAWIVELLYISMVCLPQIISGLWLRTSSVSKDALIQVALHSATSVWWYGSSQKIQWRCESGLQVTGLHSPPCRWAIGLQNLKLNSEFGQNNCHSM